MSYDRYMVAPSKAMSITPNDSTDLSDKVFALTANTAGNAKVTTVGGQTVIIPLTAGQTVVQVKRVFDTDTTASGIVGYYY